MQTLVPDSTPTVLEHTRLKSSGLMSMLYAEDNAAIRCLLTLKLRRAGYKVTPVEDGIQAWDALHRENFDLLLSDNDMPRLTGLELVKKARLEGIDLPIIMASGSASELGGPEYRWLNLAACVQKPFALDELLEIVAQILRGSGNAPSKGEVSFSSIAENLDRVTSRQPQVINE